MTLSTPIKSVLEQFKLSDAISVLARDEGKCLVRHNITQKEFVLGAKEAQVVKYFSEHQALPEDTNTHFVQQVIRYLNDKAILIGKDQSYQDSLNVYNQPFSILGLGANLYQLKNNDSCFVGVPYSRGNQISGGCDKATNAARSWLKSRGVTHQSMSKEPDITKYIRIDNTVDFSGLKSKITNKTISDIGDFYFYPYEDNSKIFKQLTLLSKHFSERNISPIYFGGDHSITYPILKGIAAQHDEFYLIHIDAHTDLYQTPVDDIYGEHCVNHHGNFLTKSLNELPALSHVFQFGIRGMNNLGTQTNDRMTTFGIRDTLNVLRQQNIKQVLGLPEHAKIYLSLDMDVLDPTVFPATNSPVVSGLQYHELLTLLSLLLEDRTLIGADIVEFNPTIDNQEICHQIFSETLLFLANYVGEHHESK